MYVRRGNCPPGKRLRENCMPGQISYISLINKSLPTFRPRKFEQRTSDSLSLIVGRYLIFARRTALKNVMGANRPGGESPWMQTHLDGGESYKGLIDHGANCLRDDSSMGANRPTFQRNVSAKHAWGETYSGRNVPFCYTVWPSTLRPVTHLFERMRLISD